MKNIFNYIRDNAGYILGVCGIISIAVGVIKANKAKIKVSEIEKESKENLKVIEEVHNTASSDEYSEEDYTNDIFIVKAQKIVNYIKIYSIPLILIVCGCLSLLHSIVKYKII